MPEDNGDPMNPASAAFAGSEAFDSPTPWHVEANGDGWALCYTLDDEPGHIAQFPDTGEEDARRAAACVNACNGIPADDLEPDMVKSLVTALYAIAFPAAYTKDHELIAIARAALANKFAVRSGKEHDPCADPNCKICTDAWDAQQEDLGAKAPFNLNG